MEYKQLTPDEYKGLASRILHEDNHILIVNKKAGEITQADKTGDECIADTYKAFIAQRDSKPGKVYMGIPHRLDRPVSGIVILAKTSKALERLNAMFREGKVHKTYLALCEGAPPAKEGELKDYLVRNEKMNKSFVAKSERTEGAKQAKLRYRHIADTERYNLLEIELLTGRHHQIRCQLSNIGSIIKGDLKYGAKRSNPDGGICLHSRRVRFVHPVSKQEIDVKAPLPNSFPAILEEKV